MLKTIFIGIGIFSLVATLLPLLPSQHWGIRLFDFPRIQILALSFISILGYSLVATSITLPEKVFIGLLIAGTLYQAIKIFPYTFLSSKEVLQSTESNHEENHISIMITNVLMTNRESNICISRIKKAKPDILLAIEPDTWWEKELSVLEKEYPYRSYTPLGNTYGMILLSKLKLVECKVKYILDKQVPSVHSILELRSGARIRLYGVHPKPPAPGQSTSSTHRDAELIIIGKEAKESDLPVIVAGDLNDVAWSHTTHLFQKISGLLDPRIGRGIYPTYNSKYPLLRWPLDHLFHSNDFKLVELRRLDHIQSDHFPIYIKLSYEPEQKHLQEEPKADKSEVREANKKVQEAR